MFDYIFFGGDLNFRLGCSAEKVKKLLENKPIKFIIKKYDQLNRFKRESSLLCDFKEKSINFMPTFKVINVIVVMKFFKKKTMCKVKLITSSAHHN